MPGFPILAGQQVMVLWIPVPNAVKYNVYMNDKKVGEAVAPNYQVPAPTEGGEYLIQVSAIDASGKEGARSAAGKIAIVVLAAPKNLSTNVIGGFPAIRWDESKSAAFYNVYRKDKGTAAFSLVGSVQTNNFRDDKAKKGQAYIYAITAKNVAGAETDMNLATVSFDWPAAEVSQAGVSNKFQPKKLKVLNTFTFIGEDGKQILYDGRELLLKGNDLFVLDNARSEIVVADKTGKFERLIGKLGVMEGQLPAGSAYAMGFTKNGNIAVIDTRTPKVVIYETNGTFVKEFDIESPVSPDNTSRGVLRPFDIAQDSKGNFFITDNGGNRILVFDESGKYVREFGSSASQKNPGGGFFASPTTIAIDSEDNIYVCDYLNERVQKFSNAGKFLMFFGTDPGAGKLLRPNHVYFDPAGRFFIVDGAYNMVHSYDPKTGKYLFTFTDETGRNKDNIATWGVDYPNSIAIDGKTLYLVEQKKKDVVQFQILD